MAHLDHERMSGKFPAKAGRAEQFVVDAGGDDASLVQHDGHVSFCDGGEPIGDDEHGAVSGGRMDRGLYGLLIA